MWRFSIIQELFYKTSANTYLEIGVSDARIIKNIKANYKIGVDPYFNFSKWDRFRFNLKLLNFKAFEITSDVFFQNLPERTKNDGIDMAFIDGLHTYEQTLRDIQNTLLLLNKNGFIVVHDCNPTSFAAAYPVKESIDEVHKLVENNELKGWEGNWNGDTWKALVHIRIIHPDLEIFTIDTDFGVGVIRKGKGIPLNDVSLHDLQSKDFYFLDANRKKLINLISPEEYESFLKSFQYGGTPYKYLDRSTKFRIFLSKIKKKLLSKKKIKNA